MFFYVFFCRSSDTLSLSFIVEAIQIILIMRAQVLRHPSKSYLLSNELLN